MIKINKVKINRFRSILNMDFVVDCSSNTISICGENNVGKTNILRAINLFFHPEEYDSFVDRPTLKEAQRGANIDPKITLVFLDDEKNEYYSIERNLKTYEYNKNRGLAGEKYRMAGGRISRGTKKILKENEILNILDKIEFRYIESINIDIPNLIRALTDDVINVEYEKTRFTKTKAELRNAYENYAKGLQDILDAFAASISETFISFKDNWEVKMSVPVAPERFRDLISDDVELKIDDKGSIGVEEKGSGLQRLAVILLNFEVLKRMKGKKNYIVCVDEPDIYLHEGLQRKLHEFFEESSEKIQIFLTTHSKTFIDQYSMRNVILVGAKYYEQYSHRKKKMIRVTESEIINIEDNTGYKIICEHLGIEENTYDVLSKENIIVEGECDRKYLLELCRFFGINAVNVISIDGVSNAEKYLEFYDSYYKNNTTTYIPKLKVLFDNDNAGRQAYNKIISKDYQNISVECQIISNFNNTCNKDLYNNDSNIEIEDLLYPELMCFLVNQILGKKKLKTIDSEKVVDLISKKAFNKKGILDLMEHEKNNANPEDGDVISFTASGNATNNIKKGLAGMFNIAGDYELISLLKECDTKYPFVRNYVKELFDFRN